MSGRHETITLRDGREVALPPFTFAELDEWFEVGFSLGADDGAPPRDKWGLVRRQLQCIHRAVARATPDLPCEAFLDGLIYRDLETQLFAAVRRVNGLTIGNPPIAPETASG